jgi:hypothetical protein
LTTRRPPWPAWRASCARSACRWGCSRGWTSAATDSSRLGCRKKHCTVSGSAPTPRRGDVPVAAQTEVVLGWCGAGRDGCWAHWLLGWVGRHWCPRRAACCASWP